MPTKNTKKPTVEYVIHDENDNFLELWNIMEPVRALLARAERKHARYKHIVLALPERVVMVMTRPLMPGSCMYGFTIAYVEALSDADKAAAKQALQKALLSWRRAHGLAPKRSKLSQRPLKRDVQFECTLGPYFVSTVPLKDNHERPSHKYILWTAHLPTRKRRRWIAVVQQVNRPDSLGDHVHNPIVFQKIVVSPDEGTAKLAYRAAQQAMYFLLKENLMQVTRPMLRIKTGDAAEWTNFEPGAATETLGRWRGATLQQIGQIWLGTWEEPAL